MKLFIRVSVLFFLFRAIERIGYIYLLVRLQAVHVIHMFIDFPPLKLQQQNTYSPELVYSK